MPVYDAGWNWIDMRKERRRRKLVAMGLDPRSLKFGRLMARR